MRARWNRAFIVLIGLFVLTAALRLAFVQHLESSFSAATNELSRETAGYDRLVGALTNETAAAYLVLDLGSRVTDGFLEADLATTAAFTDAATVFDSGAERTLVADARAQWQEEFAFVRTLAADGVAADAFAADTGPQGDVVRLRLAEGAGAVAATAQQLDQTSRGAVRDRLEDAHATKSKLLFLLATIFVLSVCATIVYARRMARLVVRPIQTLWEAADRFGAGELDHRVDLRNDDEIGELAHRFNVMADTIASTQRHLKVQAHSDVLTGLVNRAGFVSHLDASVDPRGPEAGSVSLMFIDLDDFKHVNDNLGHAAGDVLLQQVADRLRGATRATDVVCRLGGDEFAILVGAPTGGGVAVEIAERVLVVLDHPFSIEGALVRIGASIGIASQLDMADSGDHLLRAADVAMYAAKGLGKHRWVLFDPAVHGPIVDDAASPLDHLQSNRLDTSNLP